MKKICFLILAALISTAAMAQTAKSVLDKAAANITVKEGVKANFRMVGGIGNASGTILIKGKKFHATTPKATVWFDGKTMWTYMKDNEEVNVSNPTEAQLQTINLYREGQEDQGTLHHHRQTELSSHTGETPAGKELDRIQHLQPLEVEDCRF